MFWTVEGTTDLSIKNKQISTSASISWRGINLNFVPFTLQLTIISCYRAKSTHAAISFLLSKQLLDQIHSVSEQLHITRDIDFITKIRGP